ncbi:MAG: CocE/NonD family hydrolase [Clostridia bacterium]|nr:CocE/NonD family hydrolase [Clostridia bacterium]
MEYSAYYKYIISDDTRLFTVALLPQGLGKFPCVVVRTPYVDWLEEKTEEFIVDLCRRESESWLDRGYAMIVQHCRGRGKSDGDCVPYVNEGKDSNNLYDWIREQDFYNGEIFLMGTSYLTSVHYCAKPYGKDIKGAIFGVQDTERYNLCYRNGVLKKDLQPSWYVSMYKAKSKINRNYADNSFEMLPLTDFTKTVFEEEVPDFDNMLLSPRITDPFWQTHAGGSDTRGATDRLDFPVLYITGFYDIYTGGIFDMWNRMDENTRSKSVLVVSPYDHGDGCNKNTFVFKNGNRKEKFGTNYPIDWFDSVREGNGKSFVRGKVTYFRIFEDKWHTDDFYISNSTVTFPLGSKKISYIYNPDNPPRFNGGLCCNFGGADFQPTASWRDDVVSVYTEPFESDTVVQGKMTAQITVASDCEDTCFYMRVSIEKTEGDYGLRDDITTLCHQLGDYTPNTEVKLNFIFDEHSFLIKAGERLRVDISSANANHYVRHTNNKGLYSKQTSTKIAKNTVDLSKSMIILPVL